jgi:hypothetical protein
MKRRKRQYTAASLDALLVQDDVDADPILQLLQQAQRRGLSLTVASGKADGQRSPASQPGAVADDVAPPRGLGSSATTSRAIQHPSPRFAKKVGS